MSTNKDTEIIKTYKEAIKQNYKDLFPISYDDNCILLMCFLLTQQSNQVKMFLNKADFDQIYPYLECFQKYLPTKMNNLSLIVTKDVLINEKLTQAMPFKTDEHFNETHPLISELPYASSVRLLDLEGGKEIPSFIIFDKHYLVQISGENKFLCSLNPRATTSSFNRFNLLQEIFKKISEQSTPFTPQQITSYHLNLTDFLRENNRTNN
ncbi:MAG: hypothetical protein IJC11_06845 [Alphaproteobacteria bacterium]|nr:hypothetical protein [Alphaproteobacteria bacterium]MBQ6854424.1 hypothetical protein [Alphaproteobacteria bacterium]MBR3913711.1 hypothetical protein [Alphaproteobacteria bacterium]